MEKREFAINVSILSILIVLVVILNYVDTRRYQLMNTSSETTVESTTDVKLIAENVETAAMNTGIAVTDTVAVINTEPIVYNGMTLTQLANQLDKSLKSDLTGTGYAFAKYSIEYGVDPFLAVAIALHETGCNSGTCSAKVTECNNVGGQKFSPVCYAGGSYGKYATLDEGIKGFIENLYTNYIALGLNTPELMQKKYVGTGTASWATKVNRYIIKIKSA